MKRYVMVSGGFDNYHAGHADYIKGAHEHGEVIVILNSDEWLKRKKGYVFMDFESRKRVMQSIKGVVDVVSVDDTDGTVVKAIQTIKAENTRAKLYFAKGGDRGPDNTPEAEWCAHLGIEMIYNCGGGKTQSSSELVRGASEILAHG